MRLNNDGLNLIKGEEGCRLVAYRDVTGTLTIGWGHTSAAGEPRVTPGMTITQQEADAIFRRDMDRFAHGVMLAVHTQVNDNQFSALVSFAENVGIGTFRSSSVLAAVNQGNFAAVPGRLALYNKSKGRVLQDLINRRQHEAALFMRPVGAFLRPPVQAKAIRTADAQVITGASTTGIGVTADTIRDQTYSLQGLSYYTQSTLVTYLIIGLTLAGLGLTIYGLYKKFKAHEEV